jgi:glycosyltransferase involved in cell wall biosynthesis
MAPPDGWGRLSRLKRLRNPPRAGSLDELREDLAAARSLAEDGLARAQLAFDAGLEAILATRMLAFMSWLELHAPEEGPAVSVILATRDRPQLLPRAIASVLAQRCHGWQLVVVDDGETDAVEKALATNDDERIVVAQGPRRGLSAARNAGLDRAVGEIVCYLDDDNVMHPAWLQAVAYVFARRDDIDVIYGISIAEHRLPDDLTEHGWWPSFWQLPWSRQTLLEENTTDMGAMAHRRQLEEARFDETLASGEDWDLLLRLTAQREALAVPALSHAYSMQSIDRKSRDPGHRAGLEKIHHRHATAERQ